MSVFTDAAARDTAYSDPNPAAVAGEPVWLQAEQQLQIWDGARWRQLEAVAAPEAAGGAAPELTPAAAATWGAPQGVFTPALHRSLVANGVPFTAPPPSLRVDGRVCTALFTVTGALTARVNVVCQAAAVGPGGNGTPGTDFSGGYAGGGGGAGGVVRTGPLLVYAGQQFRAELSANGDTVVRAGGVEVARALPGATGGETAGRASTAGAGNSLSQPQTPSDPSQGRRGGFRGGSPYAGGGGGAGGAGGNADAQSAGAGGAGVDLSAWRSGLGVVAAGGAGGGRGTRAATAAGAGSGGAGGAWTGGSPSTNRPGLPGRPGVVLLRWFTQGAPYTAQPAP